MLLFAFEGIIILPKMLGLLKMKGILQELYGIIETDSILAVLL